MEVMVIKLWINAKKWNQVPPIIFNLHDKKIKDFKVKIYHLYSGVRVST